MEAYRSLLAVVPPAATLTPAVQRAAGLARASGATLHLCVFAHDSAVDVAAIRTGAEVAHHVRHDILRDHEERLEQLTATLAGKGHPVECDVIWAPDQTEAILAKCTAIDAQVVLKDVHHESPARRILYTPLDWKLMRLLPCELMLVKPGPQATPRRIAAAIDVWAESEETEGLNKRIIDTAVRLSDYLDTRLDLVSVFPHFSPVHYRSWPDAEATLAKENTAHYEAFAKLVSGYSIPPDRRHRLTGAPAEVLERFVADNRIDILVLGSVHQSGWERLLLGSTAETLAQQIDADLMLVRPGNFHEVLGKIVDLSKLLQRYTVEA